jgi:tRNA G10  N-methylase Trm11
LKTLLILGRQPEISLAEIRAVFPQAKIVVRGPDFVIMDGLDATEVDLAKIGGVVKVGKVLDTFSSSSSGAEKKFRDLSQSVSEALVKKFADKTGKQTYGISTFGCRKDTLKTLLIGVKKDLKLAEISGRFVNKNFQNLSSAQTQFEILKKHGTEILVASNGREWWIADLTAVQPFETYAKRDYEKAARDARVGMLPPKLAQTMINLSQVKEGATVYDPFCGTGTVLIEAVLMGHKAIGSDIDPRMIEYSERNLRDLKVEAEVFVHDAAQKIRASGSSVTECDVAVTEGYLGPPRKTLPSTEARRDTFNELADLYQKFFGWIKAEKVVITFPVYLENGQPKYFSSGKILSKVEKLGWKVISQVKEGGKLVYFRPGQIVGREIVVLAPAGAAR